MADKKVENTIKALCRKRPFLKPVLDGFTPIFETIQNLVPEISSQLRQKNILPPQFKREYAENGIPLFSNVNLDGISENVRKITEIILPVLSKHAPVAIHMENLQKFFLAPATPDDMRQQLMENLLLGDYGALTSIAQKANVPPEIMDYVSNFIFSPILRALLSLVPLMENNEYPWDEEGIWIKGYCPACGSAPSLAWFDRPQFDEKNTFIAGGGGKKRFHCTLCGADWKFRRGVCPNCYQEGDGVMGVLRSEGEVAERIDWCQKCNTYCPTIDLREINYNPDMDIMTLGLLHLYLVAHDRKLKPLKQSFWNTF